MDYGTTIIAQIAGLIGPESETADDTKTLVEVFVSPQMIGATMTDKDGNIVTDSKYTVCPADKCITWRNNPTTAALPSPDIGGTKRRHMITRPQTLNTSDHASHLASRVKNGARVALPVKNVA